MNQLKAGDLTIDVSECASPPRVELVWRGKSNDRYPGKILAPFFAGVLERAQALGHPVELRFDHLEHFNSSTIGALIELIQAASARKVPLVLTYDDTVKWQKLSFDALRVFVKGDGLLDLRGAPPAGGAA